MGKLASILEDEGLVKRWRHWNRGWTWYEFPFKNWTRKDYSRIDSMITEALNASWRESGPRNRDEDPDRFQARWGKIFDKKIVEAAKKMAKSIKDWEKAARSGAAAEDRDFHEVAKVFFDRASDLYAHKSKLASILREEGLLKTAGGVDFYEWGAGSDPRKIFNDLQDEAERIRKNEQFLWTDDDEDDWDDWHEGYSGTIAEKDGFRIRSREKMSKREAEKFADKDIDNNDKWGPAFAIPSGNGWLFYGIASS